MISAAGKSLFTPTFIAYVEKHSDKLVKDKETVTRPSYQEHFAKTKAAISGALRVFKEPNALILGVGAAQDVNLRELAKSFGRVHLVDIDLRQTTKALEEQIPEADLRAKFTLEKADLTGIFPELCTEAEKLAAEGGLPYTEFVGRILDLLPTLKPAAFPYKQTKSSFVCSSLVSTQLVGTLIGYLNALTQKTYGKTFTLPEDRANEFDSFLTNIIEAHLHELSALVSPTGRIYYADHFTVKQLAHINHPENPEINDVVMERGEGGFPFTKTLPEVVQKIFTVVSKQTWGWALPMGESRGSALVTNADGTIEAIPIQITKLYGYQISSYVLKPREVAE